MKLTVLVPTYRRPNDLARCLAALQRQTRLPDELLLVVRDTDEETWKFLETCRIEPLPLRILMVNLPGVIAAMNLGFDAAQGDIVSVTDDDAAPHPDWLERIAAHFTANPSLGGLGGRDYLYINGEPPAFVPGSTPPVVGKVQWWGRMIGNHHLGEGPAQEVDILKGVNMSLRRTALGNFRCDQRLKGTGAQVHFEVALSLGIKQQGWMLLYDPAVAVDHYSSQRFDEDQRTNAFNPVACCNIAHNETLVLLDYLSPMQRIAYLIWAVLIGTRGTPGLVQVLRFLPRKGSRILQMWRAAMQGRWQGWQTWCGVDLASGGG